MALAGDPRLSGVLPVLLYRTSDLPEEVREGAVVLGLALRAALTSPGSLERAGFGGSPGEAALAMYEKAITSPSGFVFSVDAWESQRASLPTPDGKLHLVLPDLLAEWKTALSTPQAAADPAWPFVLSAGERRGFTANTIIRDPSWRKKDAAGALRVHPTDAQALGVATGDTVRITTRRGSAAVPVEVSDSMQPGHVSLPNGMGTTSDGGEAAGVAPNELTSATDRDPFAGTPWHKHVPARIERVIAQPASADRP
jgi:anaerobic selenocysteine-containing dehydrogenase